MCVVLSLFSVKQGVWLCRVQMCMQLSAGLISLRKLCYHFKIDQNKFLCAITFWFEKVLNISYIALCKQAISHCERKLHVTDNQFCIFRVFEHCCSALRRCRLLVVFSLRRLRPCLRNLVVCVFTEFRRENKGRQPLLFYSNCEFCGSVFQTRIIPTE